MKKRNIAAKLLLLLALMVLSGTVLASAAARPGIPDDYEVDYTTVTIRKTILFRDRNRKSSITTIPKGATLIVLNNNTGAANSIEVEYNTRIGYVNVEDVLDSDDADHGDDDDDPGYNYNVNRQPDFYVRAKESSKIYSAPSVSGKSIGTVTASDVIGVYGIKGSFYVVNYNGGKNYTRKANFVRATPVGSTMYVDAMNGGRIRSTAAITANNIITAVPYRTSVKVLSVEHGQYAKWYRVLVVNDDRWYIEGFMREDVLNADGGSSIEPEEGGSNRVINTGTGENAVLRDGPNGNKIGSLPNKSTVYATGVVRQAGGRGWAQITSPKKGWIASSFIFGW